MMRQNFPYCLQFYLQLRLVYSCHYIKERQKDFLIKNETDSSNFLVVKIYLVVALRICVLVCESKERFPNKSAFIKTVSVTSSNL